VFPPGSGSRIRTSRMQISLSKDSEVPLQQQLAEQIVFLITTGRLRTAQQLPSVRALARRLKIHHNTVSKAYQDLVRRGWLRGQHGSRLYIGVETHSQSGDIHTNLDELITESIQRAREMGVSLQALREKVLERLFAAPPDHALVVEDELGLRQIIQAEICAKLGKRVETCTLEQFAKSPEMVVGAQVVAPDYALDLLRSLVPHSRPCIPLTFCGADEHVALIRDLGEPSIIGVVSGSEALLKTARSLLASALGQRHALREFRLSPQGRVDLRGVDIAFCDSLAMPVVRCPRKIHYRLIAPECLEDLIATFEPSASENSKLVGPKPARRRPTKSHALAPRKVRTRSPEKSRSLID
jgi:GntR family transcriptional regulator